MAADGPSPLPPANPLTDPPQADDTRPLGWWLLGGALYGIAMRLLFGWLPYPWQGAMSTGFLIGTPIVIGALTVYGARHRASGWVFAVFGPWLTTALMLIGCAVTLLEGAICLALMTPLFLLCASAGGVAMRVALGLVRRPAPLRAVAALPLLLLLGERVIPPGTEQVFLQHSVDIAAEPAVVWQQIMQARDIQADELPFSVTHAIGVPRPLEGVNRLTPDGEYRFSRWDKGVHFLARVTDSKPMQFSSWQYQFEPDSFPPGSMDDHVAIGGRYFHLQGSTFTLTPLDGGHTRLQLRAEFRLSTSINGYALPVARWLGSDFIRTILGLYKGRSERAATRTSDLSRRTGS